MMWSSVMGLFSGCSTTVPHHQVHGHAAEGAEAFDDAERERDTDSEQAEHERLVGPQVAGDGVVEVGEGPSAPKARKPSVGDPP